MLPSNPRAGGRSRSVARHPNQNNNVPHPRSVSRSADYTSRSSNSTSESPYYSRRDVQPANKLRTQHSMGALSSSRTKRPTDAPPIPRLNPNHASAASSPSQYARPPPSRDSDTSTSSAATSSSGSSFLDRMKNRRHLNSSQSSFELDQDLPPKQLSNQEKSRASQDGNERGPQLEQGPIVNDFTSYGYDIWNRVTAAASSWSWGGNPNDNSDITISGVSSNAGDSDLTKALKAYHISKVRDRSELPDWLFNESERGLSKSYHRSRNRRDDDNDEDDLRREGRDGGSRRQYGDRTDVEADRTMRSRQERGRGLLRDVYDSATTSAPGGGLRGSSSRLVYGDLDETRSMPDTSSNHSKATARLRALRDAKRKAAFGSTSRVETSDSDSGATGRGGGRRVEASSNGADSYAYGYERRSMSDLSSSRDGRNEMLRDSRRREPPPERPMPSVTAAARVGLPSNPRRR